VLNVSLLHHVICAPKMPRHPRLHSLATLVTLILSGVASGVAASPGDQPSSQDGAPTGCPKLSYPEVALAARAEGTTVVVFSVRDGKAWKLQIDRSAGLTREHRLLDRAAAEHLARCSFSGINSDESRAFRIDYVWKHGLAESAASAP
jgi:outer membrane biosynthesis protein TonB